MINTLGIDRAAEVLHVIMKREAARPCRTACAERNRQKELRILDSMFSYLADLRAIRDGLRPAWSGVPTKRQLQTKGLALWGSVPTRATFVAITAPEEAPDYISRSAQGTSAYWYRPDGLIRQSDHWGMAAYSHWTIDCPLRDCGWCSWYNFKVNPQS